MSKLEEIIEGAGKALIGVVAIAIVLFCFALLYVVTWRVVHKTVMIWTKGNRRTAFLSAVAACLLIAFGSSFVRQENPALPRSAARA